jgi:hypothetical protein
MNEMGPFSESSVKDLKLVEQQEAELTGADIKNLTFHVNFIGFFVNGCGFQLAGYSNFDFDKYCLNMAAIVDRSIEVSNGYGGSLEDLQKFRSIVASHRTFRLLLALLQNNNEAKGVKAFIEYKTQPFSDLSEKQLDLVAETFNEESKK